MVISGSVGGLRPAGHQQDQRRAVGGRHRTRAPRPVDVGRDQPAVVHHRVLEDRGLSGVLIPGEQIENRGRAPVGEREVDAERYRDVEPMDDGVDERLAGGRERIRPMNADERSQTLDDLVGGESDGIVPTE